MRNLKKILALVLALVMSLSLMATAGATDFTDDGQFNPSYKTAAEVLEKLGVLKGYTDGSFDPTGSISRAEVAAAVYRIVTGDVDNKQVGIYEDYQIFSDVNPGDWYAGYVNFCANAEYIKGNGDGTFDPNAKVNGYAALAMILRAIGYTANGGFTGDEWHIQAARTAESRKITKNIMTGTLGEDASRETVAEILFQAILVNMVDHNQDNTYNGNQGYTETNTTLGYKIFGLERIEGVVVGNEYADLNSDQVLPEDKTDLQVADEENPRRLAIGTKITDIGESRYAYITGPKVLAMGDTGNNTVTEFGHACDISSTSKFNTVAGMPAASDIEYYVNFEPSTEGGYDCDQRLEFSVVFYGQRAENAFDNYKGINISTIAARDNRYSVEVSVDVTDGTDTKTVWATLDRNSIVNNDVANSGTDYDIPADDVAAGYTPTTVSYNYPVRYTKVIWAGETITDTDLTVLESIFGMADNVQNNVLLENRITGDVFVGTKSTATDTTGEERDLSNQISYKKFYDEYINDRTKELNWATSWNGQWVKFVDNDGDGACEYAFKTGSFLDEAIHTYKNRDDVLVTEFIGFDDNTYNIAETGNPTVRYLDNDGNDTDWVPEIGEKVVASYIDNQYLVEPAVYETVTVSEYSWRNDEITTDKGVYGQSSIGNYTDMQQLISTMDDKTEYIVYFDHFGYVRAYELPGGTQYALVTELYYTNMQQGNLVQEWPMTVELYVGEEKEHEYNAVSGAATFRANFPWLLVDNMASTANYNNWLQPAISHLGVSRTWNGLDLGAQKNTNDKIFDTTVSTYWPANRQLVKNLGASWLTPTATGAEFNYGVQNYGDVPTVNSYREVTNWNQNQAYGTTSFTNVAIVNINGEDASLTGAAKLKLTSNGDVATRGGNPVYAVDYVQLDSDIDVVAKAVRYPIGGDPSYVSDNNTYVNAVNDTEFYIVYNGGVEYFKGFNDMPELDADNIHAAYAVARDTSADNADKPYWVADVIVFEVYELDTEAQTSVSLAYYTPTRLSGTVQQVETLNTKYGPMVTLTPGGKAWNSVSGQWGVNWGWANRYGFYRLYNDTEPVDNVMIASSIARIDIGEYAENKIFAGTIIREAYIAGNGYYIDVDMGNGNVASVEVTDKIYSITYDWDQSDGWYTYNEANLLRYIGENNSQVKAGDKVIWVNDGNLKAAPIANSATLNKTKFVVDLGNESWYSLVYAGADILTDTQQWLINYTVNNVTGVVTVDTVATTNPPADNQGEWQRIMFEQMYYVAPVAAITRTIDISLEDVAGRAYSDIPEDATISDIFSDITITASNGVEGVKTVLDDATWRYTFTFADGKEPAMYSYTYTLVSGYQAVNTKVEFDSTNATFDNDNQVFVIKAGVAKIAVELLRGSVEYDPDVFNTGKLNAYKADAKDLLDAKVAELVAAAIAEMGNAGNKAIAEENVDLIVAAVNTAAADAQKTAIEGAADEAAVDALIKDTDGTIAGTAVTAVTSAVGTAITTVVGNVTTARTTKDGELSALSTELDSAAATAVYNERKNEVLQGMTVAEINAAAAEIAEAMNAAKDAEDAAANAAIDESVVNMPGVPNGVANPGAGKLSYELSYDALGVTPVVDSEDPTVTTISINKTELTKILTDPNAVQKEALKTMLANENTMIAVGTSFKAPEGAKSAKVTINDDEKGYQVVDGYIVIWNVIAQGTYTSTTGQEKFVPSSITSGGTKTVELQFYEDENIFGQGGWTWNDPIGDTITRTIVIEG